jgi:hypothetical protein
MCCDNPNWLQQYKLENDTNEKVSKKGEKHNVTERERKSEHIDMWQIIKNEQRSNLETNSTESVW